MILEQAKAQVDAVLAPLSADRFFDDHMGRAVLALPADAAHARRALLGEDPEAAVLAAFATHAARLGSHAHTPVGPRPLAAPVESAAAFRASIAAFHAAGYTVRVPDVTALAPTLLQFTRSLEFLLHQPVKASLFWSAPDARAPIHYDDNDNIVVQLTGRKQWLISTATPSLHNAWRDVAEAPPPLGDHRRYDIAPGDLLYVPRGTPHTVWSQTQSLHLAITFTPVTLRDVLIAAIDHLSDHDRSLRETAIGRIDAPLDMGALAQLVGGAMERLRGHLRTPAFLGAALQRRTSRTIGTMEPLASGSPVALQPDTRVRHAPGALCYLLATPTMIDFCQPGEHINVHRGVEAALRHIAATPSFTVGDLPGELPDDVRIALVDRLVRSGFLEPAS